MDQALIDRIEEGKKKFRKIEHSAIPIFDDVLCYPIDEIVALARISIAMQESENPDEQERLISDFIPKLAAVCPIKDAPQRIYLWPRGKVPTHTEYSENSDLKNNHDPDFEPYMFEMLLPEGVTPKGAVICIPGGDHGKSSVQTYQNCSDLNKLGYQCFLLHNRVFRSPWSDKESGVDTARAVRIIRKNATKYRINPNNVAIAGFSNGGLTGENCIQYFSGKQTVADHFPGYVPDEYDWFYGSPDAYLCIYGPRFRTTVFDYTNVIYPPAFFAVGRTDEAAMKNLYPTYISLMEQGIPVEIHTFSGTPHGFAGRKLVDGFVRYPSFEHWIPLADFFMQDLYKSMK